MLTEIRLKTKQKMNCKEKVSSPFFFCSFSTKVCEKIFQATAKERSKKKVGNGFSKINDWIIQLPQGHEKSFVILWNFLVIFPFLLTGSFVIVSGFPKWNCSICLNGNFRIYQLTISQCMPHDKGCGIMFMIFFLNYEVDYFSVCNCGYKWGGDST